MLYFIIVVVMFVAVFVEYCMSAKWVPVYFKLGMPIYSKRFIGKKSVLAEIDDTHLNSIAISVVLSFTTPLVFKKIAKEQWALRQQSFNASIMHGKLIIEPETSKVHLVSYMNWHLLPMMGAAILLSIQHKELFIIALVAIGMLLFYFFEKTMYDRLINHLSEEKP